MILVIDNYDSFVHNLARYIERLGQQTHVVRNDQITLQEIEAMQPTAIVISPGPCTPNEAGISIEIVKHFHETIPILGVCLGHQAIANAFGGKIVRAPQPVHGKASHITHSGKQIFKNVTQPLLVCRYHSLLIDLQTLPKELQVLARTDDGLIMAIAHRTSPTFGVQFHPESILTESGFVILANFLRLANCNAPANLEQNLKEFNSPPDEHPPLPDSPVTF